MSKLTIAVTSFMVFARKDSFPSGHSLKQLLKISGSVAELRET